MKRQADADGEPHPVVPEGVRDGDVLVYMSGRLVVVDHLVPEAFTIDLVELQTADVGERGTPRG
jgi:hypothetical protein